MSLIRVNNTCYIQSTHILWFQASEDGPESTSVHFQGEWAVVGMSVSEFKRLYEQAIRGETKQQE